MKFRFDHIKLDLLMLGCWFSWPTSSILELAFGMGQQGKLTFSIFEYLKYLICLKYLNI